MPKKGGIITRKEVIEEEALKWGETYAKNVQIAIDKNTEFAKGVVELARAYNSIRGAGNNSEYMKAKEEERLQFLKNINAIKEQDAAEKALADTRKRALQEAKLKLEVEAKQESAKKRNTQLTIEERVQNEANNRVLKQEALERLGLVGAYQKLNKERTDAKRKLMDLIASESASTAEIKKAQKEFDLLDEKVRKADKAVGDFTKNVGNYPQIGKMTGMLKDLVGAFGLAVGVDAFARALGAAFEKIKEFDQGIADLKAITGATGKDLEYLKKQAIEVGKETKGGAVKVVEAYKLIASAKPELLENVKDLNKVTEATLLLSKAAGMELPEAATALTDAMNQFGADASRAAEFVDALANGAKFGSAEIPQVTDALLKFGAVAKSSNISIQESTALIELLAENGLKGAEAGTALRNVLLKLSAPDALPKEAKAVFDKLGISMEFLKDKTIPIQEKFEALKPLLKDDSDLVRIFGNENIVAAKNIISHTGRLKELTDKMGEYGTAAEQAEIRTNTLQGETEKLSAEYDSFILNLNEGKGAVSGFFSLFIYLAREALKDLGRLNKDWDELFEEARMKGAEAGIKNVDKAFRGYTQNGIKDQEALNLIMNQASLELNKYEKALNKKNQELADFNPYAINFGKSGKTLKEEKERLEAAVAQQKSIIEEAKKRILDITTKAADDETKIEEDAAKLSEEELKKRLQEELKRRSEYLKKLQKLLNDEYALMKFRLDRGAELNQEIVDDETQSIEERLNAYLEVEQLKRSEAEITLQHELVSNELSRIDTEKTSIAQINAIKKAAEEKAKGLISGVKLSKNATAEEKLIYERYQKELEDIERKRLKNKQAVVDSEAAIIQKNIDAEIQRQETELNNAIAAENEKFKIIRDGIIARGLLADEQNRLLEEATEEHERKVFELQKYYSKLKLKDQIDTLEKFLKNQDKLPEKERISAKERKQIEFELSKAKKAYSEADLEFYKGVSEKRIFFETEAFKKIEAASQQLTNALQSLANVIFDSRISQIDSEIEAEERKYNRQMELAGNDQKQKDLLQAESDKKREELEKKKRKEQHKQAVFNKTLAIADAGINTAKAVTAALTAGPGIGLALAIITAAVAAVQLAAIVATPIPKYKKGRKNGPKELAVVGDGGVHEVIERKSGKVEITPNTDTLVQLYAGDKVHSSMDEYQKAMRAANMASLASEKHRLNDYQTAMAFDHSYDREMIAELKRNTKAIEKMKVGAPQKAPDLNHHLWKLNNSRWY